MMRVVMRCLGVAAVVAVVLALGAVGCRGRDVVLTPGSGQFRGVELPTPLEKPAFTLTTTEGRPFDFRKETDGLVTLLFFGYTHCPDVCPVHLANIAGVMKRMSPSDVARLRVVFVTVDPERDTPVVMRQWLDALDSRFIGLRGSLDDVNVIHAALQLAPAQVEVDPVKGAVNVGHSAQVIAFATDNKAHLVYPFGIRQEDWAHDLPILLSARWIEAPVARGAQGAIEPMPRIDLGNLTITNAVVPEAAAGFAGAAYFSVTNRGTEPDALVAVDAPGTLGSGMMHATVTDSAGRTRMEMRDEFPVLPGHTLVFRPGEAHVMLNPAPAPMRAGQTLALRLTFRRAGTVGVPARVVTRDAMQVILFPRVP